MSYRRLILAPIAIILLGVIAIQVNHSYSRAANQQRHSAAIPAQPTQSILYYFLVGDPCPMCKKIETLCQLTLDQAFATELAQQQIVFRVIDTNQPENAHFIEEYHLTDKSLILTQRSNSIETSRTHIQDVHSWLKDPKLFHANLTALLKKSLASTTPIPSSPLTPTPSKN